MRRLWVRFSALFFLILLVVILMPITFALLNDSPNILDEIVILVAEGEVEAISQRVEEQQREFARGLILILITGGILGVLVGIYVSRTITAPLDDLRNATERIMGRDYSVRVPEKGSEEIQAVSQSFNEMVSQLEDSENLRRKLLSDVAHELRNPLHVIRGNIEAMIDGVFPMNEEELGHILGQTQVLTTLVEDLREVAQAEANQLDLNRQPTEIAKLIDETVRSYQSAAAEKEIHLELELLGKLPTLNIDAGRIRQVLLNLLSNGVRYTPKGGTMRVAVEQVDQIVEIRVKDTGAGIEPENLPYIFDRFYRTDKARTREKGGTGLGLAIVKALTEAHGGTATVYSAGPNLGTQFTLTLPIAGADL